MASVDGGSYPETRRLLGAYMLVVFKKQRELSFFFVKIILISDEKTKIEMLICIK